MHTKRLFTLILGFGMVFAASLGAQTFGDITGEVTDASAAMVAGAKVTVVNENTGATRQVTTNAAGVYSVSSLLPGIYMVRAEMEGFQSQVRREVQLHVQQTARIDFQLEVGTVSEITEVTGVAPLLTTESATTGTVIENERIVELPLNGRNYLQLVGLSPNVSFGFVPSGQAVGRQGGDRPRWSISISGQRSTFNNYTLDGVSNTDVNFNAYVFAPSIDAVQEFKVQTGVYPAEFGRVTGQINVSTKSGTNSFHGSAFEFFRAEELDAQIYAFTANRPPKDPFVRNQYGFTLGGPVLVPKVYNGRNQLFFLANYEALRDRKGIRTVANVPSAEMHRGDFSRIAQRIYDPVTRVRLPDGRITAEQFPGNIIPAAHFNSKAVKLLEFYPLPNVPTASFSQNYQGAEVRLNDTDQFTTRIDFVQGSTSNWFGRYSWGDDLGLNPRGFPQQGEKLDTQAKQVVLSNALVLSSTVVNEFRFGYIGFHNANQNFLAGVRDVIGEIGGLDGQPPATPDLYGIPGIAITGFSGFGDNTDGPFVNHDHTFQWIDNLSVVRGKHSFKFGGEVRRERFNQTGNQFARGYFSFNGTVTRDPAIPASNGNGFADYLLGYHDNTQTALGLANAQLRSTSMSYYIDDTWKIRPNLTLNLGLRYENTPPYYHKHDNMINVEYPSLFDPNLRPTLVRAGKGDFYEDVPFQFNPAIQVTRDGRLGRRLVRRDNNDFAPRLGVAYSPSSRWTIRTGLGLFYVQDAGNWRFDLARNNAGRRREITDPNFPNLTLDRPFGNLGTTVITNNPVVFGNDVDGRTSYVGQYLFNVQWLASSNTLVELGYTGNIGRKLEAFTMGNFPLPGPGPVQPRRPFPELGMLQLAQRGINSHYNAGSFKLERRSSGGFTYLIAYTFSRAIDSGSAIRIHNTDTNFPQNMYDRSDRRGLASFHQKHRVVSSVLWEVPIGRGKRLDWGAFGNAVFGNWQVGNILAVRSGGPFTVTTGRDIANVGWNEHFPDVTGTSPRPPEGRDPERFFNPAAFREPAPFTFGNSARNSLIGPEHVSWDASLMKTISLPREGHRIEFRFEAFNLPNRPHFGNPGATMTSASFTRITSTQTPMRELQFSLKYAF